MHDAQLVSATRTKRPRSDAQRRAELIAAAVTDLVDRHGYVTFARIHRALRAARGVELLRLGRRNVVVWARCSPALVDAIDLLRPLLQADACGVGEYERDGYVLEGLPLAEDAPAEGEAFAELTWVPVALRRRTPAELAAWRALCARRCH